MGELQRLKGGSPDKGLRSLRDQDIQVEDFEYFGRRNELAASQIKRIKDDPWRGEGYVLRAENEELEAQARQAIEDLDLDEMMSRALAYEKAFGMALLHIPLPKNAGPLDAPPKVEVLKKLVAQTLQKRIKPDKTIEFDFGGLIQPAEPLSRLQVEDFETNKDDKLPEKWQIRSGSDSNETYEIHRSRVIHLKNWWLTNDPYGTSEFLAQYDVLTDLANMNLAMVEAYTKMATGLALLHVPPSATDEDWQWAQENWKDIDLMSEFIVPDPTANPDDKWSAEILSWGGSGANPDPFVNTIWDRISAVSRMSKVILRGTEAGKLTGSELNYKEYYSVIEVIRKELTRYYSQVFDRLQEWGYLLPGKIWIEWAALDKPSRQEQAKTDLYESQAFKVAVDAVTGLIDAINGRLIHHQEETYVVYLNRENINDVFPDPNKPEEPEEPPETPELPPFPGPGGTVITSAVSDYLATHAASDKVRLSPEQWDQIRQEWAHPWAHVLDAAIADTLPGVDEGIDYAVTRWLADLEKILRDNGVDARADYDVGPILQEAVKINFNDKKLRKNLEAALETALKDGWDQTMINLNIEVDFSVGMPWAADFLNANVESVVYHISSDLSSKLIEAMQEGLIKGDGYDAITRRIKGARAEYRDPTYKAVHRVCHAALNTARVRAAEESGDAGPEKPLVYITMGDNKVRPDPPREIEVLLSEWNCRCTCAPSMAIERMLGRSLTLSELGR